MSDLIIILISIIFGILISFISISLGFYLLFQPIHPKLFGLIHGAFPKNKNNLAENIANHIELILPPMYKKMTSIPVVGQGIESLVHKIIEKTIKETSNEDIEILIKKVIKKELLIIKILCSVFGGILGAILGIIIIYLI